MLGLDRSHSMARWLTPNLRGYNAFTDAQKQMPHHATMSLWELHGFADLRFAGRAVGAVRHLTPADYAPMGDTRLASSLATALLAERAALDTWTLPPDEVFLLLVTDAPGIDATNRAEVRAATHVRDQLALLPGWHVMLLAICHDARALGAALGIHANHTLRVAAARHAIDAGWQALSDNVRSVRAGMRAHVRFSPDQRKAALGEP